MTKTEMNANGSLASVHLVLQGKGGVGKSCVSAILAQYFRTKSAPVHFVDTDPINTTFTQQGQRTRTMSEKRGTRDQLNR